MRAGGPRSWRCRLEVAGEVSSRLVALVAAVNVVASSRLAALEAGETAAEEVSSRLAALAAAAAVVEAEEEMSSR